MIRRPPRSTQSRSSAASDVYKRQLYNSALALDDRQFTDILNRHIEHDFLPLLVLSSTFLSKLVHGQYHSFILCKLGRRFRVGRSNSENKRAHLAYKKGKISTTPAVRLASGSFRQDEDK